MTKKNQKTILITGGAGAVGSNLCRKYLADGEKVICLDNLQKTCTTINIDDIKNHKNFHFIKHDIIDPITLPGKIDWVINMACPVSCIDLQVDPIHTVKSSVHGVINMLDLARKHGAVFLQASSADIYGEKTAEVQTESDWGSVNTLSPRACYEEGKRIAETICMDYHRQYGTAIKIARIFNTSGRGTHITDGRVISNFIFAALAGRDLTIYGDGSATRCFLYMDDLVDAIDKFMKTGDDITGPINLGNNKEVTIKELAETIIRLTGSKSKIKYEEADDAPLFRRPDITLAKKILGWEPTTPLEENLRNTINHYKTIGLPDSQVLVFATTYYPDMGPAERALDELIQKTPETEFHIITTKFRGGLQRIENRGNIIIHRVGLGASFDKYLLPVLGSVKALNLHKKNKYRFVWSVMASYGSVPALFLTKMHKHTSYLMLRDPSENITKKIADMFARRANAVYEQNKNKNQESQSNTNELLTQIKQDYAKLLREQEGKLHRPV